MSEPKQIKHIEQKRKSKKIKKCYNLFDFVVVKRKSKKTQHIKNVKLAKEIIRRGKVRKKKLTTLKKRILRERKAKQLKVEDALNCNDISTSSEIQEEVAAADKETDNVIDKIAQVKLDDPLDTVIETENIAEDLLIVALPVTEQKPEAAEPTASSESSPTSVQHSRNFRDYCNHFITPDIKRLTELVLKDLFKFQENKFQQNPIKAKANKRYVVGFKEVKKFLIVKRLKLVIIAPDLEKNSEIEKLVDETKSLADQLKIPYLFSIKRRHIGYLLLKKVPVSLVGIFDYQGTSENVNELLKFVQQEKINYRNNKTADLK